MSWAQPPISLQRRAVLAANVDVLECARYRVESGSEYNDIELVFRIGGANTSRSNFLNG